MKFNVGNMLEDRLVRRELGQRHRYATTRGIYGDVRFVNDLDIVNELTGHDGCVNALSWSTSGKILASGSDDRIINLYSYLPEDSTQQFALATQIDTGHNRNIFSVKFMPHSSDRKIVSCAGDSQVRVFDIERASIVGGEQSRLSALSAKGKAFRSHSSSAKRLVTEASPFYFLSCAEDGDVRQWDIRQPESAYPSSRSRYSMNTSQDQHDDAPPPLISYRNFNIDLFTISCSPSQPHYIALGGRHLHCFLHDRRMLGRDKLKERGMNLGQRVPKTDAEIDAIMAATRCVRKFAPHGQPIMSSSQGATITACKISNANPSELVVSWSGDHIYSFDMLHDDNAEENGIFRFDGSRENLQRKRKRLEGSCSMSSSKSAAHAKARSRTQSSGEMSSAQPENVSILVRLRNGESIEIPIENSGAESGGPSAASVTVASGNSEFRIAKEVMHLRREMFICHTSEEGGEMHYTRANDALQHRANAMLTVVTRGADLFERIDDMITKWSYPITHSNSRIAFEQKLRDDRSKVWRFVQAAGCLARGLLKEQPADTGIHLLGKLKHFDIVRSAPRESSRPLDRHEHFCYDFIKAVLLWLDSGIGAVVNEFTKDSESMQHYPRRQPIQLSAGVESIGTHLMPYLRHLALERPIIDVDSDEPGQDHILFESELAAVRALERAMDIPFADLQRTESSGQSKSDTTTQAQQVYSQPRSVALKFWGMKVCRSLLRSAAIDIEYSFTEIAFDEMYGSSIGANVHDATERPADARSLAVASTVPFTDSQDELGNGENPFDASRHSLPYSEDEEDSHNSGEEDDESEEEPDLNSLHRLPHAKSRIKAGKSVVCSAHLKEYRGHCNVDTTKDVNFYGLQDEYVVSGSDCGHVFIWDKKTAKLLNVLEGDGEVVNVIQPHPYEPLLAVSGIDHTIKIFSPDRRARRDAELGIGIVSADPSRFSSIGVRNRQARRQAAHREARSHREVANDTNSDSDEDGDNTDGDASDTGGRCESAGSNSLAPATFPRLSLSSDDTDTQPWTSGLVSMRRMASSHRITSQNDMDRRRGSGGGGMSRAMMALMTQRFRFQLANMGLRVGEGDGGNDDPEDCVTM